MKSRLCTSWKGHQFTHTPENPSRMQKSHVYDGRQQQNEIIRYSDYPKKNTLETRLETRATRTDTEKKHLGL